MSSCDNSNIKKNYIVTTSSEQEILSACTAIYTNNLYPCDSNNLTINSPLLTTNDIIATNITLSGVLSACTGIYTSNLYGCSPITIHDDLLPNSGDTFNLGTPIRRFRDVNTVSGTSTVWTSTNVVNTPNLNLGLDSDNNQRTITADNSVIQDDILNGGLY
jgi:hypothetical protein